MTIQSENNSSELIDVKAETAKNDAAILGVLKDNPGMSSFFGGGGGGSGADTEYGGTSAPSATRQSSEIEHFMTAGISSGGKKAEMAKQGMEIMFDGGSKGQSMFFSGGKKGGSFNISYAGEKGASRGPVQQKSTPLVDPGYFANLKQARKGGTVDENHIIVTNVNATGKGLNGISEGNGGTTYMSKSVAQSVTSNDAQGVTSTCSMCNTLIQKRDALHQIDKGPMSRNRIIEDLQNGKEGGEQVLRNMTGGQKVETFRNMSPSVKNDILDGPGT